MYPLPVMIISQLKLIKSFFLYTVLFQVIDRCKTNISILFFIPRYLYIEQDFRDISIASEDNKQVDANKAILYVYSFFSSNK